MPIKKSAIKALRQTQKKNEKNSLVKENIAYLQRVIRKAVTAGDSKQLSELTKNLIKAVDKATQNGIIKKNTASRIKSRLAAKQKTVVK